MFTGLCAGCRHHAWIESGRGSRFLRCELSFRDKRFAKYPVIPVLACPGYEPGEANAADDRPDGEET